MAITKTEMRPGEIILTNRVRMNHPANHRTDCLPETDQDLCRLICKTAGVAYLNIETAREWCHKHIIDELDKWDEFEQRVALDRFAKLWRGGKN